MQTNLQNANAYFATHSKFALWDQFDASQKEAAIEQADLFLSRALRRPMRQDEPPVQKGDHRRDDLPVFEQALHYLMQLGIGKARGNNIGILRGNPPAVAAPGDEYAHEALRWLGISATTIIRG